jgi:hypothetical protein
MQEGIVMVQEEFSHFLQRLTPYSLDNGVIQYRPEGDRHRAKPVHLPSYRKYQREKYGKEFFILGDSNVPPCMEDIRRDVGPLYDFILAELDTEGHVVYYGVNRYSYMAAKFYNVNQPM